MMAQRVSSAVPLTSALNGGGWSRRSGRFTLERDLIPIELGVGVGVGPVARRFGISRQIFVEVPVIKIPPKSIRLDPR